MQFNGSKSSFNFYKKEEDNLSNAPNHQTDNQKPQNLFSENSQNADQHYSKLSSFSNSDHPNLSNREENDSCQEYHCLTCNRTYDGLIKCRHNNNQNDENNEHLNGRNTDQNNFNRTYECPFQNCQKKFNLQSGLIRHKVVHTGQKPYSCDYQNCSQSFNQKSNLNRHKKIHKNQKPFICQKCCKSFTTTTNLKQHSQTHIQKKQERKHYTCEIKGCNKKYLYRCNLKKHKQQHDDPVGGCLLSENDQQKSVKKAKFQISLNHCNVSLQLWDTSSEDHSQMKITYDQNIGGPNAQIYNPILMLPSDQKQQKINAQLINDQKMQQQKVEENLIKNLQQFFVNKPSQISASFYLHPDLIQYSKIIISQVITLLQQKGTKQIRFYVKQKDNFETCVKILLSIYFDR